MATFHHSFKMMLFQDDRRYISFYPLSSYISMSPSSPTRCQMKPDLWLYGSQTQRRTVESCVNGAQGGDESTTDVRFNYKDVYFLRH